MKKKIYMSPSMKVVELDKVDIIATSDVIPFNDEDLAPGSNQW